MELVLTKALLQQINAEVRLTPFNSDEIASLAKAAGVHKRHVQAWFAPPDAKIQRDLLPIRTLEGKNLRDLPENYRVRFEAGFAILHDPGRRALGNKTPTHKPPTTHKGGIVKELPTPESYKTLQEAIDRVEAYQKADESVDPFLAENWTKLRIEPEEEGGWRVRINYLSGFKSPPVQTQEEYEEEEEDFSYDF